VGLGGESFFEGIFLQISQREVGDFLQPKEDMAKYFRLKKFRTKPVQTRRITFAFWRAFRVRSLVRRGLPLFQRGVALWFCNPDLLPVDAKGGKEIFHWVKIQQRSIKLEPPFSE
jgi:hypothetical protein